MAEQSKCLVWGNWQCTVNLLPGFSQTADVGATLRDEEICFHMTTSNWHFQQGPKTRRAITLPHSTLNCCLVLTKEKKKKKHPEKIMQWCSVCPSIFYSPLRSPNQGQKDLWPGIFREATALTVKRRPPCILLCSEVKTSNRAVKSVRRPTATCALISN